MAYALLAVAAARTVGLLGLSGQSDLTAAMAGWWWPAWSVAALVIAGVLWPVLLGVVVLFPVRDAEFAAAALWPVAITAVVVGIAAALSAGAARRGQPAPRPH